MASFLRRSGKAGAPLAAAWVSSSFLSKSECGDLEPPIFTEGKNLRRYQSVPPKRVSKEGMQPDEEGDFHGLFPLRQLWRPQMEYPLWNRNWDGREPDVTGDKEEDRKVQRQIRKEGVTRHIILIRHGQYDENHQVSIGLIRKVLFSALATLIDSRLVLGPQEDEKRVLTPLGRQQAALTGKRLAAMIKGAEDDFGPCNVKVLRVSDMQRAKETAQIIHSFIPQVKATDPDPLLNEGRPCHNIPGVKASQKVVDLTDEHHPRIEKAFRKYFYRHEQTRTDKDKENKNPHEFEIIVCHANVIRYMLCRALQLPPEVWLRYCPFNCSLTYITIRPTGSVSCRLLGDIGHLPYNAMTFSKHEGFNW
jgi:serine/threonine-protein phosphatase PGAM5